jgi:hypothetical protein
MFIAIQLSTVTVKEEQIAYELHWIIHKQRLPSFVDWDLMAKKKAQFWTEGLQKCSEHINFQL